MAKDELANAFNDSEEVDESEVETEEVEEEAEETETETETEESETTADEKQEEDHPKAFKAAYLDEKRKRQALEDRLSKLETLVPKEEEQAPDPYEDLDAYNEYQRKKWEQERTQEAQNKRLKKIEERRSEMLEKSEDFLEMERIFELLSVKDTAIRNEMLQSDDPVGYAYSKAKEYHDEILSPKNVLSTEMPDDKPAKKPAKPSLAKATASKTQDVEVDKEPGLSDVFADMNY